MKKKIFFLSLILLLLIIPLKDALAAALVPCGLNGAADCTLCHLVLGIKGVFDFLLKLLLAACLLVITIAGVLYMVSAGSQGLIEKAKKAFTYSITALVLLLCSWLIVNAVMNALGFKQAGSWSKFECDTTQTVAPTGTGAGTGAGTGTGGAGTGNAGGTNTGSGSALSGTIYEYGANYRDSNGVLHTDCSGYSEARRIAAGYSDPGRDTATQSSSATSYDSSQLREGSLLFSTSAASPSGRHVAVYNGDGTVSHNSGKNVNVVTVSLEKYASNRNITGMLQ